MVAFISYGENLVPLPSADLRRQSPRSSAGALQASRNQVAIRRGLMRAASRSGVEVAYEHDRQGGIAWHLQEFVSLGDLHARTDLLQMRRHEAEGMA